MEWLFGKKESEPVKKVPTCKICCACPETKSVRDDCVIRRGEENCAEFVEAHLRCLVAEGFDEQKVDGMRTQYYKRVAEMKN